MTIINYIYNGIQKTLRLDPYSNKRKQKYQFSGGRLFNGSSSVSDRLKGGDYLWIAEADTWNGATATLEKLASDGITYKPVDTATQDKTSGIGIAQDSRLRVTISGGPPTNFRSNIAGIG